MSFIIDSQINSGYPYIEGITELPDTIFVKPYFSYIFIVDDNKNNGYPAFESFEDIPTVIIQKLYLHGLMICMGNEVNNGYPCIPEINNVTVNTFSNLFFAGNHIIDMYYQQKHISLAYCNEKEVFSIKYISI